MLILVVLIQSMMQLTPGIFLLFYHYLIGRKSTKKASDYSLYFILGSLTYIVIIWLACYGIIFNIFCSQSNLNIDIFIWIMAGILFAESILVFFYYFRKSKATALFIPRSTANQIEMQTKNIKTRLDAFLLGFFSGMPELFFTLPIYIVSTIGLMSLNNFPRFVFIIIYIIFAISPLFYIRSLYKYDYNLAEIERRRVKTKPFIKLILCISYLLLTFVTIGIGVLNNG